MGRKCKVKKSDRKKSPIKSVVVKAGDKITKKWIFKNRRNEKPKGISWSNNNTGAFHQNSILGSSFYPPFLPTK